VARGWQVEGLPCNRGCRDEATTYPSCERWHGVDIRRIWRPVVRQASPWGRVLNSMWMIAAWSRIVLRARRSLPDVLVVGTDPALGILVAPLVKLLRRRVRIAHWCFDLYPEAPVSDGLLRDGSLAVRALRSLLRTAYRSCDLIADIGSCMRDRLAEYDPACRRVTLVPWALREPPAPARCDPEMRRRLFGGAALGLLYSGNFGRAHSCHEILELARRLRGESITFCFGVRGNRAREVASAVGPDDANVALVDFGPESELEERLAAADIHLVSLREDWTGVVVPSKFFGSLAVGRPVMFAGSRRSAVARWIEEHEVGWILDQRSLPTVALRLRALARDKSGFDRLQRRCHEVYQACFSKRRVMDQWDAELRALLRPDRVEATLRQAEGTS
jgi:colanic acid biosynthesis glycosyl transferase WcaI